MRETPQVRSWAIVAEDISATHWVQAQLRAGKKLEHFLIARSSTEKAPPDWVNSLSHAGSPLTV
jgi:hypothetical protein